jgi:hypothetical protein
MTELTRRERQFLAGKLKLKRGSVYERQLRSRIKRKLGYEFAVVCIYCERAMDAGKMWELEAGDNVVYACTDCAPKRVRCRSVRVTQLGNRR